jgi:dienelactone hydrolase
VTWHVARRSSRDDNGVAERHLVYYGTAPADLATLAAVKAPVLGLYGGKDARVDATLAATTAKMKELGKSYEPHVFDGAGHGFLRLGWRGRRPPEGGEGGVAAHDRLPPSPSALAGCCAHPSSARR